MTDNVLFLSVRSIYLLYLTVNQADSERNAIMWWKRPRIVYIDTRILFLKIILVLFVFASSVSYWQWTKVTGVEFVSDELASSWMVCDKNIINQVCRGLKQSTPARENIHPSGILLKINSMKETKEYLITDSGFILEIKSGKIFLASNTLRMIGNLAGKELKQRSPFGEIVNWKRVKEIIPVGEQLTVRDLDSGWKFNLKRTGGYSHADVEPLTRSDTMIIKNLYGGHLSWKRRAVVVELHRTKIAASFTGAAAGNGEIRNNDISGKMNLYFNDSDTDDGRNLSHRVTIWRAAGKSCFYLKKLNPEKTIMVLFTALDQQDPVTLNVILNKPFKGEIDKLIGVTVRQITKTGDLKYRVIVSVSLKGGPYNERRMINLNLSEDKNEGRFRVDGRLLDNLLI